MVFAATVASLQAGCSAVFVDAPPADHPTQRYFDCTSSRLAPVSDTVLTGLGGLATLGAASDDSSSRAASLAFGSAVTIALAASAIHGFSTTSDCRVAKSELERRVLLGALMPPRPNAPGGDPWLGAGPPPGYVTPPPPGYIHPSPAPPYPPPPLRASPPSQTPPSLPPAPGPPADPAAAPPERGGGGAPP